MFPKPPPKAKRRKALRPVSDKRLIEQRLYQGLRALFLRDHLRCEARVCCDGERATDVHHKRGRGRFYLAVWSWLAVCRRCHTFLTDNPGRAYELGLSDARNSLGGKEQ